MRPYGVEPFRTRRVFDGINFKADIIAFKAIGGNRCRATTRERVEYQIAFFGVLIDNLRQKICRFLVLVYLFFSRHLWKVPYILQPRHIGLKRGASFVCINDKLVTFAVLCAQIARGVIAFIPYNKVFDGKVFFDFLFEKIDFITSAKHIKRGVVFHNVIQKGYKVDYKLRVIVVLNSLAKLMRFILPSARLIIDKVGRVGYYAINAYPPPRNISRIPSRQSTLYIWFRSIVIYDLALRQPLTGTARRFCFR
nr:MAG TPA: hypothetical protein [Caudoviricetes sp.]